MNIQLMQKAPSSGTENVYTSPNQLTMYNWVPKYLLSLATTTTYVCTIWETKNDKQAQKLDFKLIWMYIEQQNHYLKRGTTQKKEEITTLESGINMQVLIFEIFSRGNILIKGGYIFDFWFLKKLFKNFYLSFPLAKYKRVKLSSI